MLAEERFNRILNIVEETVKKLPTISQKVTLFSTSSTFESTIYQNGIIHNGHEFIFKDEWQIKLNNLIQNIKMDAFYKPVKINTFRMSWQQLPVFRMNAVLCA